MTKYMIHAVPKRMWYVEQYLIPSMIAQGIDKSRIIVYNDSEGQGNLKACMNAFKSCEGSGGTWHLQDDVCICNDFKYLTELYDRGLVCGFSTRRYDGPGRIGAVKVQDMWFSFPCIRIPNDYARECGEWVLNYIIGNPVYTEFTKNGTNDDWAFRLYLRTYHKDDVALNIAPNLIDHIDYLIGGGTGGKRKEPVRAQYWRDEDIVKRLEEQLNGLANK